ncbi:MAG: IPT/TIG domain-containing protein [Chitinophagaceae bacterium]|nr:IPT/TIG domain-containing protein [Chitinophagaceae bacterium]
MYKKDYWFILILIAGGCFLGVSCKKDNSNPNQGISYGITGIEPMTAEDGDTIRIYGIGFRADIGGNEVNINNAVAKVVAASSDELSVVVPAGAKTGTVAVKTANQTNSFSQPFNIIISISGDQDSSRTLTPEKLYLLKGDVRMKKGTVLTIQPGTVILADKISMAGLTISDGASIQANGAADKPIVFTSGRIIGDRNPGDWKGITLDAGAGSSEDILKYVRIEFAGFHLPYEAGAALRLSRSTGVGKIAYVQTSYSGGDGFRCDGGTGVTNYLQYLVAFGCAGNDFDISGDARVVAQFITGLKDPKYADQFGADGLLVQSSRPATISNLTLMGPNGLARAANLGSPSYYLNQNPDDVLNNYAGRGVHVGGYSALTALAVNGTVQLFNSVIAARWLAGISIDGSPAWDAYENGGSVIRRTTVTYTLANFTNTYGHLEQPARGNCFNPENIDNPNSGFGVFDITQRQCAVFNTHNDTAALQLATPFVSVSQPNSIYDDLGLWNMALYKNIASPVMTPADGSSLLQGASYMDAELNDNFIDKSPSFRGAFGSADWTKSWSNYSPMQTSYN